MNVLAIVAHPDDELIGCGATLRKLHDAGHRVFSCVLSANADARFDRPALDRFHDVAAAANRLIGIADSMRFEFKNIQLNVVPHLELVRAVEEAIVTFQPSWIFTHYPGDLNIDHRVCYEVAMAAALLPQRLSRDLPVTLIERILLMELPSSTDWAFPVHHAFSPNSFFEVRATMSAKLDALRAFEGALKPYPHSRSEENIMNLARVRGAQIGVEMAEAFCLVRDLNL
jgi:LmbE family N-acetylglucosaminyl deacetylase